MFILVMDEDGGTRSGSAGFDHDVRVLGIETIGVDVAEDSRVVQSNRQRMVVYRLLDEEVALSRGAETRVADLKVGVSL